jgi:predicted nuclease of predicted toxin-antitoxin system
MQLLVDMGIARRTATDLANGGIDAVHVGTLGHATATDRQIVDRARADGRIVVTLDRDFSQLLATEGFDSPSVIYLRIDAKCSVLSVTT